MKSMKKKILSAVAAVAALAPVAKSYARSDNANNFSSSEKVQQGANKEELIEDSITSIQQFMNSKFIKVRTNPIFEVTPDGVVSAKQILESGEATNEMTIGTGFEINRSTFANWLQEDIMRSLDTYYNARHRVGVWLINKLMPSFVPSRGAAADMCKCVKKLKEQGIFEECIGKYVEEILDSEIEKAQVSIEGQKTKFQNFEEVI